MRVSIKGLLQAFVGVTLLLGVSACCRGGSGTNSSASAKCKQVGSSGCKACCTSNKASSSSWDSANGCTCY